MLSVQEKKGEGAAGVGVGGLVGWSWYVVGLRRQREGEKQLQRAEGDLCKHYEKPYPWLAIHNHWSRNVNNGLVAAK